MGTFMISNNKSKLDIDMIHHFLSEEAYWSKGIAPEIVKLSIEHSLCFGVYDENEKQVGFARVVTDYATVAYLGDVFILPVYRGRGLSKMLIEAIMQHPFLQGLRRWILLTGDAHGLYQQFGWKPIAEPVKWMELHDKYVYTNR
jgi:GNAT superfamily N-acetyltransferase